MNPQALMSLVPWVRRIWKVMPPQLRVPFLVVIAGVGVVQFVQGRKAQLPARVDGATADPRTPDGTDAIAGR